MVGAAVAAVAALAGDIAAGARLSRPGPERFPQQLRQLGDIRRDPPRLIFGEELGGPSVGPLTQQSRRHAETGGFTLLPTNADFRERHRWGCRTGCGGEPTPYAPLMRHRGPRSQPDHKNIRSQDQRGAPGIGATSGKHCADTEPLRL